MKTFFNIARNVFAVIGLVLTVAMVIVLCSDDYDEIRGKGELEFNIRPVTDSSRAAEIREYFQLDTLYEGTATTWEKTLAIAKFVATYITCMPEDSNDNDCHVVNQVWLPELGKWVMIDSDSGGFYATDGNGNLLSLQEMRESYIQGKPILYHPQFAETGISDSWYYDYMAKNTYWFSCWETLHFDQEPAKGKDAGRYIHLVPNGFKPFGVNRKDIVTNDAGQFWAAPGQPV